MSDYLLNSSISINGEEILDDINNIFQKKDIWTNGPFNPEERLGWVDFEKVINSSHENCISILNKIEFENIIFIGMGGSIQTGKVLKQMQPNKNILFLDSTNPLEIKKSLDDFEFEILETYYPEEKSMIIYQNAMNRQEELYSKIFS